MTPGLPSDSEPVSISSSDIVVPSSLISPPCRLCEECKCPGSVVPKPLGRLAARGPVRVPGQGALPPLPDSRLAGLAGDDPGRGPRGCDAARRPSCGQGPGADRGPREG